MRTQSIATDCHRCTPVGAVRTPTSAYARRVTTSSAQPECSWSTRVRAAVVRLRARSALRTPAWVHTGEGATPLSCFTALTTKTFSGAARRPQVVSVHPVGARVFPCAPSTSPLAPGLWSYLAACLSRCGFHRYLYRRMHVRSSGINSAFAKQSTARVRECVMRQRRSHALCLG